MAVSFIGKGNQSTWRKPQICCMSLINLFNATFNNISAISWLSVLWVSNHRNHVNGNIERKENHYTKKKN
jgi:hypothetical protein